YRWVFGSKSPNTEPCGLVTARRSNLVVSGYRVEKPDLVMRLIFLIVFEIRVARSWIESRSGLRLMRGDQRFLKSNFIGGIVRVTPVVAVISEGDDRLCRIEV